MNERTFVFISTLKKYSWTLSIKDHRRTKTIQIYLVNRFSDMLFSNRSEVQTSRDINLVKCLCLLNLLNFLQLTFY